MADIEPEHVFGFASEGFACCDSALNDRIFKLAVFLKFASEVTDVTSKTIVLAKNMVPTLKWLDNENFTTHLMVQNNSTNHTVVFEKVLHYSPDRNSKGG